MGARHHFIFDAQAEPPPPPFYSWVLYKYLMTTSMFILLLAYFPNVNAYSLYYSFSMIGNVCKLKVNHFFNYTFMYLYKIQLR